MKKFNVSIVVLVAMVVNFVCASCDNEELNSLTETTTSTEKKEKPVTPTPEPAENWWLLRDSVNTGHEYSFDILAGDSTSGATATSRGFAGMDEETRYTIEERYRVLDLAYANAHKAMAKPECETKNGSLQVKTLCTFNLEDGNVVKVNSNISHAMATVKGVKRFFPCDSLTNVELISLKNVEKPAQTRAAEEYISDSVYTEVIAKLHYVTTGLKQNYSYTQEIGDTIVRYILSKNDIASITYDNVYRKVISSNTEECGFDKIVIFANGEKSVLSKKIVLQYGVENIPEYEKQVSDFGYNFVSSNGISNGEVKFNRTEEFWTVDRRVDSYSSNLNNGAGEAVQTEYTLFHESTVYNDGDITVEFPMIDMNVTEGNTTVTPIASTKGDWYEMARLDNDIVVDYQSYAQTSSEDVILYKEARRIVFEGWDEETAKKEVTLWNVHTSIDYVIVYSDNTEERTNYVNDWAWSFGPKSSWTVIAENNSYFTSTTSATVNGSSKSETKQGVEYNWVANAHSFVANVSVANGTELDEWEAKTVNDITVTRNGHVYSFGHDDYQLVDNGTKLSDGIENEYETVYNYTHSLTFGMADVTSEATVDGVIKVEKTIVVVPTFFDKKVVNMTAIVSNNPAHTDYVYTALAHLEGGYIVPGVWNRNGELVWHTEWMTQSDNTNLNGCAYEQKSGTWKPVYGHDTPDMLQYDTEDGYNADNQSYATANKWNWDEGRKVNGHASVTTSRIQFTIANGVASATDTYTGANLGSWTYAE